MVSLHKQMLIRKNFSSLIVLKDILLSKKVKQQNLFVRYFPLFITSTRYNKLSYWQCSIDNFWSIIFSASFKFRSIYITGWWGEFREKHITLHLHIRFCFCFFVCLFACLFLIIKCVFYQFLHWGINQSEAGLCDKTCRWKCMYSETLSMTSKNIGKSMVFVMKLSQWKTTLKCL